MFQKHTIVHRHRFHPCRFQCALFRLEERPVLGPYSQIPICFLHLSHSPLVAVDFCLTFVSVFTAGM